MESRIVRRGHSELWKVRRAAVLIAHERLFEPGDFFGADSVFRLKTIEQRSCGPIAQTKQPEEVRVLLGVKLFGKGANVGQHRAQQLEVGLRIAETDLAHEIEKAVQHRA